MGLNIRIWIWTDLGMTLKIWIRACYAPQEQDPDPALIFGFRPAMPAPQDLGPGLLCMPTSVDNVVGVEVENAGADVR